MNSLTLEAFITEHLSENLSKIFERKDSVWESQGIDDSYFLQVCPLYEKSFEGSKKVKITLEVIDEESN